MVYIFPAVLLQLRQRNSNIFNFQGLNKLLDLKLASTGYPKSNASTIAIGKLLNLKFQIVAIVSNDTLLSLSIMCQYFQGHQNQDEKCSHSRNTAKHVFLRHHFNANSPLP